MKILKLLNSKYLSILLLIFLTTVTVNAEDEPIDIWNIDQNKIEENSSSNNLNNLEKIYFILSIFSISLLFGTIDY